MAETRFSGWRMGEMELVPMHPDHAHGYAAILSHGPTYRFLTESGPINETEANEKILRNRASTEEGSSVYWSILGQKRTFLGFVSIHNLQGATVAMSYGIHPEHRRQGIATKVVNAVLQWKGLEGKSIELATHLDNQASFGMLQKLALPYQGVQNTRFGQRHVFLLPAGRKRPNYFLQAETARRYAQGRPDFHKLIIEHIRATLGIEDKLAYALDVACGTGLSTRPLLDIATQVEGTDASEEMLAQARQQSPVQIRFQQAFAEQQPFEDQSFDLITVSSGLHWFDIDAFLRECHRLLKQGGWIVLYNNYFQSRMLEDERFYSWVQERYLGNFPSPARNKQYDWSESNLRLRGFEQKEEAQFTNEVSFTQEELILYFTTQSNIATIIDQKRETHANIESWLMEELTPFFPNRISRKTFLFGNRVQYLRMV